MSMSEKKSSQEVISGNVREVFSTFLKLGLTSFGGPIAHLSYFHRELVERRRWISDSEYAQLLGLCQFLPGPASSQLGFSLGLLRAGWPGAIAAFLAFTLPSALLLLLFAALLPQFSGQLGAAALHGLKLVALVVVAHGVLRMLQKLCPDLARRLIAGGAACVILLTGQAWLQLLVVALGALAGLLFCRPASPTTGAGLRTRYSAALGRSLLLVFVLLLIGLPLVASTSTGLLAAGDAFYRTGALVFGGGHVVLPLLEESVVHSGWISGENFLAGYGAAQAVPGPMFSFAAYLGALLPDGQGGAIGAVVAMTAIFLPGFLLVAGVLPLWQAIMALPMAARAIAGANAAVVGLLGAALYDPVWTGSVFAPVDIAIAVIGFALLSRAGTSTMLVVLWCVAARIAAALVS